MNNCKEIQDLILTDYIDGQADQETKSHVENHLLACADCRVFAQEVKANLVVPFERAQRQTVPAHLWNSIKEKIEEEQYARAPDFLDRLLDLFSSRLAPVLASLAVLIVVGSFVFHDRLVKHAREEAQGKYLASLLSPAEDNTSGLGTTIEEYFL